MSKLLIEIPGIPPAAIRGNVHPRSLGGFHIRAKASKQWKAAARAAILDALDQAPPFEWDRVTKAHAHVTFVLPDLRRLDIDNLEGQAMKPAYDELVDLGVLADDNWKVLSHSYVGVLDRERGPMTIVEVEAI